MLKIADIFAIIPADRTGMKLPVFRGGFLHARRENIMAKTVVVTGGSRGIGAEIVRLFSAKGWRVLFCFHNAVQKAQELQAETGAAAVQCDVRCEEQVRRLADTAVRQLGHIDALICNAGAAWNGLTEEMPVKDFDRLADTNIKGAFLCVRQFLPYLRESKGSILLVSSMWGTVGASCETVYSATKAALQCMARSLAKEVGPSGVRVNCIAPGVVDTDMMSAFTVQEKQKLASDTPLGRLCTARDVAEAACFFLGDGAAFITGQTLTVDGGFSL